MKIRDKTVDLKEIKGFYGRLMVLSRSNRDIDQKQPIGHTKGTVRAKRSKPCTNKSRLIHLLEKLGAELDDAQQQLQDANGLQGDPH